MPAGRDVVTAGHDIEIEIGPDVIQLLANELAEYPGDEVVVVDAGNGQWEVHTYPEGFYAVLPGEVLAELVTDPSYLVEVYHRDGTPWI